MVGRSVCCERENWKFLLERRVSNDGVGKGGLDWNICLSEEKGKEGRDRKKVRKVEIVSDCSCHAYSASRILASRLQ